MIRTMLYLGFSIGCAPTQATNLGLSSALRDILLLSEYSTEEMGYVFTFEEAAYFHL